MRDQVRHYLQAECQVEEGARMLVGVSGGMDSMSLVHVLQALGYDIHVAHVNYGLRDEASDEDERFVSQYYEGQGLPIEVYRPSELEKDEASFQAWARDLRYRFFQSYAEAHGISYVAVGHHEDDQAETLMMRLMRGAGIEGLAAMPPSRPIAHASPVHLIRPFLATSRSTIQAYAKTSGLTWREDASNQKLTYQRNQVRHTLLSVIANDFGPNAVSRMAKSAATMREYLNAVHAPELHARFKQCTEGEHAHSLSLKALGEMPAIWQTRLILEALERWLPGAPRSRVAAQHILGLLTLQPGRRFVTGAGVVWREREALRFVEGAEPALPSDLELHENDRVWIANGILHSERIQNLDATYQKAPRHVMYANAEAMQFPLHVRPWRSGDRIQPLGMKGSRKVSDVLTDLKVPSHLRQRALVVESAGQVAWLVGMRIAEPFKVLDPSKAAVRLTYEYAHED